MDFRGKTVLITGASRGIGAECALEFARNGASAIVIGYHKSEDQALALEATLRDAGVNAMALRADVRSARQVAAMFQKANAAFGPVHILINNAGFGAFGHFWEVPLETELNMIDLNIRAVHILTKLFLADFRARDNGYILNVASSAGFLAGPLMSTYYATKSYVLRFTEALHEELRRTGSNVKISALCPGHVETGFDQRANVKHSIGGLTSRKVAKIGLNGMFRGDVVILPGLLMKLTYIGEKFLTEPLMLRAAYTAQSKKR